MKRGRSVFWGLILVFAAVLLLLSESGLIEGMEFGQIAFSILWGALVIKGLLDRESFTVFMGIAFLCIVWDRELGIENLTPWPVIGAAILLSIGFSMIFKDSKMKRYHKRFEKNFSNVNIEHIDGENIKCYTKFSGTEKYIDSQNLKSVEIMTRFGGASIYMDKAKAAGEQIVVNIDCQFGGVEIYVPKEWKVESQMDAIFAGVDGTDVYNDIVDTTVILIGKVTFGGVDINYV